jgi:hypothetical protein
MIDLKNKDGNVQSLIVKLITARACFSASKIRMGKTCAFILLTQKLA